jgi:hypothetical protein
LKKILKSCIIIITTGDDMDLIELSFFYGDYSMLPTSAELFENSEGVVVAEEISS